MGPLDDDAAACVDEAVAVLSLTLVKSANDGLESDVDPAAVDAAVLLVDRLEAEGGGGGGGGGGGEPLDMVTVGNCSATVGGSGASTKRGVDAADWADSRALFDAES
jgi:hypothetical protein